MRNYLRGLFIILIVVGVGIYQYFHLRSNQSSPIIAAPSSTPTAADSGIGQNNPTTLIGDFVCLPHRNTQGAQTMECAFGLQTHPDLFYALDLTKVNNGIGIDTGKKVRVTGLLKLENELNTDQWQKYNIKGIIAVDKIEYETGQ